MTTTLSRRARLGRAAAAVLTGAALLAGCGSAPTTLTPQGGDAQGTDPVANQWVSGPDTGAAGEPRRGGTLRIGQSIGTGCIDPHQNYLQPILQYARTVADSLVDQDATTGELVPWLATSWTVSPDGRSYTFTLRDDVTFSDGTPLTPEVVKQNFDTVKALGARAQRGATFLADYTGTRVDDAAHTATVTFSRPAAGFLRVVATPSLAILAPSYLAQSPDQRCSGNIIGSGPFVVQHADKEGTSTVVRRPGYAWAPSWWGNSGEAHLDAVQFINVKDDSVLAGSLGSDQVDLYMRVKKQDADQLLGAGDRIVSNTVGGIPTSLYPNLRRPLLADPVVRTAIAHTIDRDQIAQAVLAPWFRTSTSALSTSTYGYTDSRAALGTDPAAAAAALDAAGWKPGPDGIRVKDGTRLAFSTWVTSDWQSSYAILDLIQAQLKAAGIDLTVRRVSVAEGADILKSGDYDFYYQSNSLNEPDVLRLAFAPGPDNLIGLTSAQAAAALGDSAYAKVAAEIARQSQVPDETQRKALAASAQDQLLRGGYLIPVYDFPLSAAASPKVHGLVFSRSDVSLNLSRAWLSP